MRRTLPLALLAGAVSALCLWSGVRAQQKPTPRPPAPARIAVVDMSHIYAHYEKVADLRETLKAAAEAESAKAKGILDKARTLQEELQTGEYDDESPEFLKRDKELISLSTRLEVLKKQTQIKMKKKDAELFIAVWNDIQQVLDVFAEQNGYTLILQVNRESLEAKDKLRIGQTLSQTVVHCQGAEDITDAVLDYLSKNYVPAEPATAKAPPAAKSSGVQRTSGTAPRGKAQR